MMSDQTERDARRIGDRPQADGETLASEEFDRRVPDPRPSRHILGSYTHV